MAINTTGDTLTLSGGWLQQARRVPSPNFGPRPEGCAPRLLVIHNISLPPGQYGGDCIERLFTNCLDWDE
ncbi:MAG: 1,6-anhydro-N-acetylmuramyl-L-alanine amidase AmpD, partial [Halioglobus sp.]